VTSTLDGMIGPWSLVSSARYGFARVFGVSEPTTLTHLRWFRVSLTQARPLYIDLWNGVDQNVITEIANPVDDGTIGWQDTPLSTGAVLQPGGVYTVVSSFGVTTDQARADVSVQGEFPFPFLRLETGDRFPTTHTGYPTTRDLVNFYGVDVIVTPVAFTLGRVRGIKSNAKITAIDPATFERSKLTRERQPELARLYGELSRPAQAAPLLDTFHA